MHARSVSAVGIAIAIIAGTVGLAVSPADQSDAPRSSDASARPLMLDINEGELRTRRLHTDSSSPASSQFILKVSPKNNGSEHLVAGTEVLAPGATLPKHRHLVQDEILLIEGGTAHVWLGDQERDLHSGGLVFIPANTWISGKNVGTTPIELTFVFSAPGFEETMRCNSVPAGETPTPITPEQQKECAHLGHAESAGSATAAQPPISADEVTLRHRVHADGRVTIFLLDIPPGQATVLHRHDHDMLSVFVNGGRTRASFNGAAPVEDSFTPGDVRFRSAGFTHSTENIGAERFLCVIFEFVDSQGARASATRPASHICNPDNRTACVDERPLFCTSRFCVDDLVMAPGAVRPAGGVTNDRILVAVSGYTFSQEIPGTAATVHTRKSGEIERLAGGPARRWTNTGDPAHLVVVTFR